MILCETDLCSHAMQIFSRIRVTDCGLARSGSRGHRAGKATGRPSTCTRTLTHPRALTANHCDSRSRGLFYFGIYRASSPTARGHLHIPGLNDPE
ncbi:hypothetical protein J6590_003787 [Homalodisca vitripennis]|nr:hypothetical protein J6590_003787 [Homalodisca vitripennis]